MKKNPDSRAWGHADACWTALLGHAKAVVAESETGRPMVRYEVQAAKMLVKLGDEIGPREAVVTAAAMFLMQEKDSRRFRDDDAFTVQLARRVRGLGETAVGRRYDHAEGRVKRVYKDVSLWTMLILGRWIADATGVLGLHLAKMEAEEEEARKAERNGFHEALRALA